MNTSSIIKKLLTILVVTLLTVCILLAPSTAFADNIVPLGFPTEIDATPGTQYIRTIQQCLGTAHWKVYLSGGTSGPYYITVSYGNGSRSYTRYGTFNDERIYYCCGSCVYNQTWRASRTGGGGTDYDYTKVYCSSQ